MYFDQGEVALACTAGTEHGHGELSRGGGHHHHGQQEEEDLQGEEVWQQAGQEVPQRGGYQGEDGRAYERLNTKLED